MESDESIITDYWQFLHEKGFPCIAAKAALSKGHIKSKVLMHMACPAHDAEALQFIYDFVDVYRTAKDSYHSAAVIYREPRNIDENTFDHLLWQRLRALSALDKLNFKHDVRVDSDPASANFSFSLKGEAFFIVGLYAASSRKARQFKYPSLIFNPHAEFEKLRAANRYTKMKEAVRNRDIAYSGSINPMLDDFGKTSEVYQYSGKQYPADWICPLLK